MTPRLRELFDRVSRLPADEQDAVAHFMRAELEAAAQWDRLFADPASDRLLDQMAGDALVEHHAGLTTLLDPDSL